jgi:hypothetical protein
MGEIYKDSELKAHKPDFLFPLIQGFSAPEGSLQSNPTIGNIEEAITHINPTERKSVNMASITNMYEGEWYYQGYNPTCTAWAIANAGLAMGLRPDINCIKQLSKIAKSWNRGLKIADAMRVVNSNAQMPYSLVGFGGDMKIIPILENITEDHNGFSPDESPHLVSSPAKQVYMRYYAAQSDEAFTDSVIKEINRGVPIIISVGIKEYLGKAVDGPHAICLTGYKVDSNGNMDIQVLDSARGSFLVPKERIERARLPIYLYKPVRRGASV